MQDVHGHFHGIFFSHQRFDFSIEPWKLLHYFSFYSFVDIAIVHKFMVFMLSHLRLTFDPIIPQSLHRA